MATRPVMMRLMSLKCDIVNDYKNGYTMEGLQEKYACSNRPLREIILAEGIMRPNIRPQLLTQKRDEVINLYRAGWSTKQLGDKFGADRNTVSEFLKRNKVRRHSAAREREFFIQSDTDKGMLAGLLLGEGSIIITGPGARISIVNQDAHIIGWLGQFGGRIHWFRPRPGSRNPCGTWNLSRSIDVFHCLSTLLPILVGKKKNLAVGAINVLKSNYGFQLPKEDLAL